MDIKVGDYVKCVCDYTELQSQWPSFVYPKIGDVLKVTSVYPHPNENNVGLFLLEFENCPSLPHQCHMDIYGNVNYEKIMRPFKFK